MASLRWKGLWRLVSKTLFEILPYTKFIICYCSLSRHQICTNHFNTLTEKPVFLVRQNCSKLFHNNENCTQHTISIFHSALIVISPSDFLPIQIMGSTEEAETDDKENTENKMHCNCKISTGFLILLIKERSIIVLQNYSTAVTELMFFY